MPGMYSVNHFRSAGKMRYRLKNGGTRRKQPGGRTVVADDRSCRPCWNAVARRVLPGLQDQSRDRHSQLDRHPWELRGPYDRFGRRQFDVPFRGSHGAPISHPDAWSIALGAWPSALSDQRIDYLSAEFLVEHESRPDTGPGQ